MSGLFGSSSAILSECGIYRYVLTRRWDWYLPTCHFVMLNPSTADHDKDDPTIRRCRNFASAFGYGAFEVRNLFAFRSVSPDQLRLARDPVGPENDAHLSSLYHTAPVIAAWGDEVNSRVKQRADIVRKLFKEKGLLLQCLGVTVNGCPRHPLYVQKDRLLVPYTY